MVDDGADVISSQPHSRTLPSRMMLDVPCVGVNSSRFGKGAFGMKLARMWI